jgi:hypothetical protein
VTQKERVWWYVWQNLPVPEAGSVLGCFVACFFWSHSTGRRSCPPAPVFLPDAPSSPTMLLRYGTKRGGTRLRSSLSTSACNSARVRAQTARRGCSHASLSRTDFRKLLVAAGSLFSLISFWAKSITESSLLPAATGIGVVSRCNPVRCVEDVGKPGQSPTAQAA